MKSAKQKEKKKIDTKNFGRIFKFCIAAGNVPDPIENSKLSAKQRSSQKSEREKRMVEQAMKRQTKKILEKQIFAKVKNPQKME